MASEQIYSYFMARTSSNKIMIMMMSTLKQQSAGIHVTPL